MRPSPFRATAVRALILSGVVLLGSGCVVRSSFMRFAIPANHEGVVLINGKKPDLLVENLGPGQVNVTFMSEEEEDRGPYPLGEFNSQQHKVKGPARLMLVTEPENDAFVQITAVRCQGMVVEQMPIPRDPELEKMEEKARPEDLDE